ncbi:hypothetical protein [Paraburkholderia sp. BL17N1]|uniref:hypothetical protein n=1 Tax=Paraburkholderia sp. BL17N1 TaxID=1938798 RepID=UPI000F1F8C2E|nr:hypothetical protein [Paraburkholderia sp. BL17N1]RKR46293.1 hypothetical protein B0G82_3975 [Paraburkholderia sp. BL17N1]
MKLCKDCLHCEHSNGTGSLDWCRAPQNRSRFDPVTGMRVRDVTACEDQRAVIVIFDVLNNRCGKRARWFVQNAAPTHGAPRTQGGGTSVSPPATYISTNVLSVNHEPTLFDVGQAAERGVDYRFLGMTGEEDA